MTTERQSDQRVIGDTVELIREVAKVVVGRLDPALHHRAYRALERAMRALGDSESPREDAGTTIANVEHVRRTPRDDR